MSAARPCFVLESRVPEGVSSEWLGFIQRLARSVTPIRDVPSVSARWAISHWGAAIRATRILPGCWGVQLADPFLRAEMHRLGATLRYVDDLVGCAGWVDLDTRVITVSDELTDAELRCTVMHDLGHIELGHSGCGSEDEELQADAWAAMRLVPEFQWLWALELGRDDRDVMSILGIDRRTYEVRHLCRPQVELQLLEHHKALALKIRVRRDAKVAATHVRTASVEATVEQPRPRLTSDRVRAM